MLARSVVMRGFATLKSAGSRDANFVQIGFAYRATVHTGLMKSPSSFTIRLLRSIYSGDLLLAVLHSAHLDRVVRKERRRDGRHHPLTEGNSRRAYSARKWQEL